MFRPVLAAYRDAFAGLPRRVWLLSAVTLIHRSGTMVLPFLTLYLTTQRGMSVRTAGLFLAVYGVGSAMGAILSGRLAERVGTVRAMQATLGGAAIGFFGLGMATEPRSIAAILFLTSLAAEGFRTPSSADLGLSIPPHVRARGFALRRLAINLGMSIGPAVGGLLATVDYRWLFLADGATCLLAAIAVTLWLRPREPAHRETRDGGTAPQTEGDGVARAGEVDSAAADSAETLVAGADRAGAAPVAAGVRAADADVGEREPTPARSLWRDRVFVAALGCTVLLDLVFVQLFGTYPLTLHQDFAYSEAMVGAVLAFSTILIVLFEMVLVHRLSGRRPLAVVASGCVAVTIGFALIPYDPRVLFALLAVAIITLGEMLTHPIIEGFVADRVPEAQMGRAMGILTAAFSITFVLAPIVGTLVYDLYGYRILWLGNAAVALVTALGFAAIDAYLRRSETAHGR